MASFYGEGDYELTASVKPKYALTKDQWDEMTATAQKDYFIGFSKYLPPQRPTTITDREKLIELSSRVNATKGKDNQRKRTRTEKARPKYHGKNPLSEKPRSEFMKEYDAMCAKDLRANIEKPPNEDFENDEVTDDYNLETNFHTNEEVNPKKGANSRQKYIKNKENMYGYWL